jgi:hypothetical protein
MSLSIARDLGNAPLEAHALRRLGDFYRHQHRPDRALAAYNDSLALLGQLPDAIWEPRILVRRGDILAQLDDQPGARRSWQQGATLLRQHGSTELAVAESRLSAPVAVEPTQFGDGRLFGAFDPRYFIDRVAESKRSVRLLNTWTDLIDPSYEQAFSVALSKAVTAGALIQILLLDPDSAAAAKRAEELLGTIDVPKVIRGNLRWIAAIRARLSPPLRPRLAVRIYGEPPLTAYHRWDGGALVSTFPMGHSSSATTQHEASVSATLVEFIEQRFENLWGLESSTGLDDYLRMALWVMAGEVSRVLQSEYVRVGGGVFVADARLADLVSHGRGDGLIGEVRSASHQRWASPGRCRMVPLPEETDTVVHAAFEDKYGKRPAAVWGLAPIAAPPAAVRP